MNRRNRSAQDPCHAAHGVVPAITKLDFSGDATADATVSFACPVVLAGLPAWPMNGGALPVAVEQLAPAKIMLHYAVPDAVQITVPRGDPSVRSRTSAPVPPGTYRHEDFAVNLLSAVKTAANKLTLVFDTAIQALITLDGVTVDTVSGPQQPELDGGFAPGTTLKLKTAAAFAASPEINLDSMNAYGTADRIKFVGGRVCDFVNGFPITV